MGVSKSLIRSTSCIIRNGHHHHDHHRHCTTMSHLRSKANNLVGICCIEHAAHIRAAMAGDSYW